MTFGKNWIKPPYTAPAGFTALWLTIKPALQCPFAPLAAQPL